MVSCRPAAGAGSEVTLAQLLALHFISAKAPITLISLSEALGTRPLATSAMRQPENHHVRAPSIALEQASEHPPRIPTVTEQSIRHLVVLSARAASVILVYETAPCDSV